MMGGEQEYFANSCEWMNDFERNILICVNENSNHTWISINISKRKKESSDLWEESFLGIINKRKKKDLQESHEKNGFDVCKHNI